MKGWYGRGIALSVALVFSQPALAQDQNDDVLTREQQEAIRFNGNHAENKYVERDRVAGSLMTAITGIEATRGEEDQLGTGFFIDACHVVTAQHVVMFKKGLGEDITVGWGPPPSASQNRSPQDLAGWFPHTSKAHLTYLGTLAAVDAAYAQFNREIDALGDYDYRAGQGIAGDWAVLELDTCAEESQPLFKLPEPPFDVNFDDRTAEGYLHAFGYPDGDFRKVRDTRCVPIRTNEKGMSVDCTVISGNSGGPITYSGKGREDRAEGLLSGSSANIATFVSTRAAAWASRVGDVPDPAPAGCVAQLKGLLRGYAGKNGLDLGADDETITPDFQFAYLLAGSTVAAASKDEGSSILPPRPDRFWCEVLSAALGTRAVSPVAEQFVGDWHDPRRPGYGIRVERGKHGLTASMVGDDLRPLPNIVGAFGPRLVLGALKSQSYSSEKIPVTWTVDFHPGRPPLIVGESVRGGGSDPYFQELQQGASEGPCAQKRKGLLMIIDRRGGLSDVQDMVLNYNRSVELGTCPLPFMPYDSAGNRIEGDLGDIPPEFSAIFDAQRCQLTASAKRGPDLEIACANGFGGVLVSGPDGAGFVNCLALAGQTVKMPGRGVGRCTLPQNQDLRSQFEREVKTLNLDSAVPSLESCHITSVQFGGVQNNLNRYFAKCEGGRQVVVAIPVGTRHGNALVN